MNIPYERVIISNIVAKKLIPIVRFNSFESNSQRSFFVPEDMEIPVTDKKELLDFQGCFACMLGGFPISAELTSFGYYGEPLYIAGIKPDAIIACQSIDIYDEDEQYSWTDWQTMTAKEFFYQQIKFADYIYAKHGEKESFETLKNQCIINPRDLEYVEQIDILGLLESVDDPRYKIMKNKDIHTRIIEGLLYLPIFENVKYKEDYGRLLNGYCVSDVIY